jgi:hypothetical protein
MTLEEKIRYHEQAFKHFCTPKVKPVYMPEIDGFGVFAVEPIEFEEKF